MIDTSFWLEWSSWNFRNPYRQWCIFRFQILPNPFSVGALSRRGAYTTLPTPLVGWGGGNPCPSLASSFPVGPRRWVCIGPTRWLIRPWWKYFEEQANIRKSKKCLVQDAKGRIKCGHLVTGTNANNLKAHLSVHHSDQFKDLRLSKTSFTSGFRYWLGCNGAHVDCRNKACCDV